MSVLETVHLVTQRNQPYGSVRLCCEMCGRSVIGKDAPRWTDDLELWDNRSALALHGKIRCVDVRPANEASASV